MTQNQSIFENCNFSQSIDFSLNIQGLKIANVMVGS